MGWSVGRVRRAWLGFAGCLLFAGAAWAGDYDDGVQFYHDGAYDKAFAAFSRAAGQGDAAAQSALAAMLYNGEGTKRDLASAAAWYLKAAELGNRDAQFSLGELYEAGEGVDKDV